VVFGSDERRLQKLAGCSVRVRRVLLPVVFGVLATWFMLRRASARVKSALATVGRACGRGADSLKGAPLRIRLPLRLFIAAAIIACGQVARRIRRVTWSRTGRP
jgi:hypothetical protein